MRHTSVLTVCAMATLAVATNASAAMLLGPSVDVKQARLVFTGALLDWCGREVASHSFAPTAKIDPLGGDWAASVDASSAKPAKGKAAPAALARTHTATGVMVELNADKTSCFVQIDAAGSDVLAAALKATLTRWPYGAVEVRAIKGAEGEGSVFAIRAGKEGPTLALSLSQYRDHPGVLTGVLQRDAEAPKP